MAKKGFFPIMRGETHTTTAAATWGDDTSKEVGVIKAGHNIDFDGDNFPGEPGDFVLIVNTHAASTVTVTIAPDPLGDADADTVVIGPGDTTSVIYHPENGWLFVAGVSAA